MQVSGSPVTQRDILNATKIVLYYSNDILEKSLPDLGAYISLGITVVNVIMTFPPILLIDVRIIFSCGPRHLYKTLQKLGRRKLLLISTIGQLISLVFLGYGLNSGKSTISSISILTFVMWVFSADWRIKAKPEASRSFAFGLGPIPFVIIPEVSPAHVGYVLTTSGVMTKQFFRLYLLSLLLLFHSTVSTTLATFYFIKKLSFESGIANFTVGLAFLPVRNFLSGGDMYKEGQVFYAFVAVFSAAAFWLFSAYKPGNIGLWSFDLHKSGGLVY